MQLFERVRHLATQVAKSQSALAAALGLKQATFQGYLNEAREDNLWPLLQRILEIHPDIRREWLYFGEGPMLRSDEALPVVACQPTPPKPIPVVGLASCGVEGWEQVMQLAVSTTMPVVGDNTVAVIAAGDSMIPAGIASGHICYCDPDQQPLPGDAVMITRRDGLTTIKLFLGEGERGPNWIRLKGWLPSNGNAPRKDFFIDMLKDDVKGIAPVIYVRRRI